ncbi:gag protease polyprotein [Cucumis melo var. makuwa]|uniref:Gag protease polyprotein n=1 Tax=Cucumis melo var. makuwa TaxID=1194695 RepID=A0A5A7T7A6_CUCMM|nr:gag protease polyprotein [Cucumis melo var. makuwa]TYK07532.1 gag protease polyprotein [Cucumis melo var. makuwa]
MISLSSLMENIQRQPSPTVLLLGSTRTASHRLSLPRLCSVGRRASSIDPPPKPSRFSPSQSLDPPGHLSRVHSCRVPVSLGASEVTLEFRSVAARVAGSNSPLLGKSVEVTWNVCNVHFGDVVVKPVYRHGCLDVLCIVVILVGYVVSWNSMSMDYKVLRYNVGITHSVDYLGDTLEFELSCGVMVSFIYGVVYLTDMCVLRDHLTDMCKGTARSRLTRAKKDAYHMRLKESLVVVREMPPRRGARRGGRGGRGWGAGRVQPEPAPPAPALVPVVPQVVSDQLSVEAKHLRDFRKYNPTTFDGSLEDPNRAQMWLSSLETIFRYMKCPKD